MSFLLKLGPCLCDFFEDGGNIDGKVTVTPFTNLRKEVGESGGGGRGEGILVGEGGKEVGAEGRGGDFEVESLREVGEEGGVESGGVFGSGEEEDGAVVGGGGCL